MNSEKIFKLSSFERALVNICQSGDCIIMSTSFFDNKLNIKLDKSIVKKALILMQNRHPLLNSYLETSKLTNKMLLKVPSEKLSDKIKLEWLDLTNHQVTREQLINESAKFHAVPFFNEEKSLLWKIQVIEFKCDEKLNFIMNLVTHMIISDGLSISCLSVEIVNIINALIDGKECDEMKILLEPLADLHTLCKERNLFKESHLKTIEELSNAKKPKLALPEKFNTKKRGFLLDLFKLDKIKTETIMKISKSNGIRVTSYFQTIAIYALRKLFLENDAPFPEQIPVDIPANLRFRLNPKVDLNACRFLTAITSFATDKEKFGRYDDFWTDARYIHEMITKSTSTETGSIFSLTHSELIEIFNQCFRFTNSSETACKFLNLMDDQVCDLSVSNLGPFVNDYIKEFDGNFSIKEIYCSDLLLSVPKITNAIIMHVMYWKGETMFQMGANNYYIDLSYFKRYKELLMEFIDFTINNSNN
ncbi:hypothetical protein BpHYR1_048307 [Brachionus plicatilis]|uniref:Condensation domain-containing protein n=1 Tax=Brachionus plicatilis TaxID=10195 RepID=A0A3M7Q7Z2_BRAPC|nr:hypothetical protein BpHYR1_048307 [Brachionus plicatilis]